MATGTINKVAGKVATKSITSYITAAQNVLIRTATAQTNSVGMVTLSFQFDIQNTAKSNGDAIITGVPYKPLSQVFEIASGIPTDAPVIFDTLGVLRAAGRGVPVQSWYSVSVSFPVDI